MSQEGQGDTDPFSDKTFDQFWLNNVFPDPNTLFAVKQRPVDEIKDNALVALDANVLLLPYEMGAESFSKVADVYKTLSEQDRLFVPAQAAREFVKNRASKLRDLVKQIGDQAGSLNFSFHREIGFLEKEPAFAEVKKLSESIAGIRTSLLTQIRNLRSALTENVGSDPVSAVYQELMSKNIVGLDDDEESRKKLLEDVKWRYRHKVPPGYKDKSKDDGGIGDFLIWRTILDYGKQKSNDCIFVTKDLKGDWWVQSQGAFQPRIELIEEYFRYTGGRTIHFMSLSSLLETLNVSDETVTDVKRVEASAVQKVLRRDLRPTLISGDVQQPLFGDQNSWSTSSIGELIKLKRDMDNRIQELYAASRPLKRKIDSPDLVDSLDEASILELYEQNKSIQQERIRLRASVHAVEREILRRASSEEE